MKLSEDEIQNLITGAVRFEKKNDGFMPIRFTEEQSAWYQQFPDLADKVFSAAGMRLDFSTDAREMKIRYTSYRGSSRKYCFFDVYQDGILVQHCGTDNREKHPEGVLSLQLDGVLHKITIYLPNTAGVILQEMELLDYSCLTPEKRQRKLLVFGDSITQGYDAFYPSFSYINRIADHFGFDLLNKAVGGDTFTPEIGTFGDHFTPDRIFIAYGTNDWSHKQKDEFEHDTEFFFYNLRRRFPQIPLHVLLPIWREDFARETFVGTFQDMRNFILGVCGKYSDIQVIDGLSFFPRLSCFFYDNRLHPNDMGFLLMAGSVIRELEKNIK